MLAALLPGLRLPRGGEGLGLLDLHWGHEAGHLIALLGKEIRLSRGQVEPHVRLHIVLRHALSLGVHTPEVELG